MNGPSPDTAVKRWMPRFSLRVLFASILMLAIYLALWRATSTVGVNDCINQFYGYDAVGLDAVEVDSWTPMPMIVRLDEPHFVGLNSIVFVRRYYFWYFFDAVRLPFQGKGPPGPTVG